LLCSRVIRGVLGAGGVSGARGVLVVRGASGVLGAGGVPGVRGVRGGLVVLAICSASIAFILLDRVIAIAITFIIRL
jgi:hypothetical protein